ncbi:MAG: TniQ family protein [Rhodanobacteraceae bacterium]|nr:TniQ family protein [Rhodanobacteraceae bacterium]MBP9154168.1 TniQ family protein [Xanthomonadales bacterium]
MIRVSPMPGEIAEGHLSRIRIVNGISSRDRLIERLRAQSNEPSSPVLHLLAAFSGMDSTTYAIDHSMMPALRVASRDEAPAMHGSQEGASFSRRLGMLAPRPGSRVCRRCTAQNLVEQGFSWYQREHQLIGVDLCVVHGCGLCVFDGVDAYSEPPEIREARGEFQPIQVDVAEQNGSDSFVTRFVSISCSYLHRNAPLSARALHAELASRARAVGLRISDSGNRPLLSDAILEQAPKVWLQAHFPRLFSKSPLKKHYPIDALLMPSAVAGSGDAYAMAIAAISSNESDSRAPIAMSTYVPAGR